MVQFQKLSGEKANKKRKENDYGEREKAKFAEVFFSGKTVKNI